MGMIAKFATLLIAAIATLSACGSDEGDGLAEGSESPTLEVAGAEPGDFVFEYQGATGVITVLEPTDPAIADVEEYRQAAEATPVTYYEISQDNTNGQEPLEFAHLTVVGAGGTQVEADALTFVLSGWSDKFLNYDTMEYTDEELHDRGGDLRSEYEYDDMLMPGAKATVYVASDAVEPETIHYVPHLMDSIEAQLIE